MFYFRNYGEYSSFYYTVNSTHECYIAYSTHGFDLHYCSKFFKEWVGFFQGGVSNPFIHVYINIKESKKPYFVGLEDFHEEDPDFIVECL